MKKWAHIDNYSESQRTVKKKDLISNIKVYKPEVPELCPFCSKPEVISTSSPQNFLYCKFCKIFLCKKDENSEFRYTKPKALILNPLCENCNLKFHDLNKNIKITCTNFQSFLKKSFLCPNCKLINESKLKELFFKHNSFFRKEKSRNLIFKDLFYVFILVFLDFFYSNIDLKSFRFFFVNFFCLIYFGIGFYSKISFLVDFLVFFFLRDDVYFDLYWILRNLRVLIFVFKKRNRGVVYEIPGGIDDKFEDMVKVFNKLSVSN